MLKKINKIFLILTIIFILLILRIAVIATKARFLEKAQKQQYIRINIINRRGDILDRNKHKIVNCQKIYKAFIVPEQQDIDLVCKIAANKTPHQIKKLFEKKIPFVVETNNKQVESKNIKIFEDYKRYPTTEHYPVQLIGYCNKDGEGVSGLELHYNEYLKQNGVKVDAYVPINAKNKIINKNNIIFKTTTNGNKPLILTIDNKEQYLLNRICRQHIKKGAGLIMDSSNGQILAMCSLPTFNPYNIKNYLEDPNLPFLNRTMLNFPIGSIFKIVTAAAALDAGIDPSYEVNCKGYCSIADTKYRCHKRDGHGTLNMKSAMQNSCNPYFIKLAQQIGAEKMLKMAKKLGFDKTIKIANNLETNKSELPPLNMTCGELANFSFGQGIVRTSMLHVAQMFSYLENNNYIVQPYIIYNMNNNITKIHNSQPKNMVKQISKILTSKYKFCSPLGDLKNNLKLKTSSAQNTKFKKDATQDYLNTWVAFTNKSMKTFILMNNEGLSASEEFLNGLVKQ